MIEGSQLEMVRKCSAEYVLAVNDTMNVLSGKWKLPIIATLTYGKKRFRELEKEIPNITPRMLSKELRELEMNGIVVRSVYPTVPVKVEYELTNSGQSLNTVLEPMIAWGLQHRANVLGKSKLHQ